jgi:hypothetical protein
MEAERDPEKGDALYVSSAKRGVQYDQKTVEFN